MGQPDEASYETNSWTTLTLVPGVYNYGVLNCGQGRGERERERERESKKVDYIPCAMYRHTKLVIHMYNVM